MEQNELEEDKITPNEDSDKDSFLTLSNKIKEKFLEKKDNLLEFLKNQISVIEKKFDLFALDIETESLKKFDYIENNISDINDRNNEYKKNSEILINTSTINDLLLNDIKKNFEQLTNLLNQKIFEKSQIENENENENEKEKENEIKTLTEEIISIINKPYFSKYKTDENILSKLKIKNSENINDFQKILNYSDLLKIEQITMKNLNSNDINTLYPENSEIRKILKIKNENDDNKIINDLILKNCTLETINISEIFPNIKNLYISNCQLPFELSEIINLSSLITLKLENVGLITENFDHLFTQMRKNDTLKKNLKILSAKNNNISIIELSKGLADNEVSDALNFCNLEEFDLSCNKLSYLCTKMFSGFKNIKIFDITDNNLNSHKSFSSLIEISKAKKFLLLITKNLGLLKENIRKTYINYLFNIIPKIDYELKNISLCTLYMGENYTKMMELDLNKFNGSLQELDLSFGNLKDEDLINILDKNIPVNCLKKLVLISNNLTDKFLELLVEKKFSDKLSKLKELNLSNNEINFTTYEKFKLFLENFKFLKLFTLKHTPIELYINNYMKNKIVRHYEIQMKNKIKTQFSAIDLEIQKLIDPETENFLVKNTDISLSIIDLNNGKYTSKVKKYYPLMLERVDVEIKFFDPN